MTSEAAPGYLSPAAPANVVRHRTATTVLASLAVFFIALELTVIAVALPAMTPDFPAVATSALNKLFTAYNWVTALLLLACGLLADRYGRKRAFLLGLTLFGLGSAGCGLADTFDSLLGFRVLQALGGAFMAPASLALILAATQQDAGKRNQAIAIWGTMAGLAAALGPLLGALAIELGSWRWVFLAPVPIIALTAIASHLWLTESTQEFAARRYSENGRTESWCAERVQPKRGLFGFNQPQTFWLPTLASIPFVAAFTGWLVSTPLFLVAVWQFTPTAAGLAVAPAPLAMAVTAGPATRLANRVGILPVTLAASCFGMTALTYLAQQTTTQPEYLTDFLPAALLMGMAVGAGFPLLTAAAMSDVDQQQYAWASGIHTTARQFAMGLGAATAGLMLAQVDFQTASLPQPTLGLLAFHKIWQLALGLFAAAGLLIAGQLFFTRSRRVPAP